MNQKPANQPMSRAVSSTSAKQIHFACGMFLRCIKVSCLRSTLASCERWTGGKRQPREEDCLFIRAACKPLMNYLTRVIIAEFVRFHRQPTAKPELHYDKLMTHRAAMWNIVFCYVGN